MLKYNGPTSVPPQVLKLLICLSPKETRLSHI